MMQHCGPRPARRGSSLSNSKVSVPNYHLLFPPSLARHPHPFFSSPFGRRSHFIMAHAGPLLPTSSRTAVQFVIAGARMSSLGRLCRSHLKI